MTTPADKHAQSLQIIRQRFMRKLKDWLPDFRDFLVDISVKPPMPQDIQELRMGAHKLAGSATTFGFEILTLPAQKLEAELDKLISGRPFSELRQPLHDATVSFIEVSQRVISHIEDKVEAKEEKALEVKSAYRVLVVDDDELVRSLLVDILEPEGCHVIQAEDGIKAMALMESFKNKSKEYWPDLVVLDINMPEMSGVEVLKKLKQDDSWKDIPIMLLSRRGEDNSVVECLTSGAMDFITKPFDIPQLAKRILQTVRSHKIKLLVIDDDSLMCQLLRQRFSYFGYTVLEANTGTQGLRLIETEQPHLIILDVVMPGMDGISVLRHLKQRNDAANIPVVILSAKQQTNHIVEGLSNGAYDYVTKPFDLSELEARVNGIIQRQQLLGSQPSERPDA